MIDRPFRWAILGTGPVARKFTLGLRRVGAEAWTIASRDPAHARAFAADLGVPHVAESYDAAARSDVDALYIATPATLHEAHAMLGIRSGRAILIEKPLAPDATAARRIARAAEEANVFAMEALWTRFQPLVLALRDRIRAGEIGTPQAFEAAFLGATVPDPEMSLFDAARAGGALLHRGIYPLSLAQFLMGPVTEAVSMARIGETGVDEETAMTLRHASGAISTIRASLRSSGEPPVSIRGTRGTIVVEGPVWRPTGAVLHITHAGRGMAAPARFETLREKPAIQAVSRRVMPVLRSLKNRGIRIPARLEGTGYQYEAAAVMRAVRDGSTSSDIMPLADSIAALDLIDGARAGWRQS